MRIWQQVTDYNDHGTFQVIQAWIVNAVIGAFQFILIVTLLAAVVCLCLASHLRAQLVNSLAWVLIPSIFLGVILWLHRRALKNKTQQFDKVRDLVQGSVEASVDSLQAAYEHFSGMKTIKIIGVKQDLWTFQKVTVHYVFDEAFVGEMDFRFKRWTPIYHAKMFMHEVERAT